MIDCVMCVSLQCQHEITGRIVAIDAGDIATEGVAEEGGDYAVLTAGAAEPEDERDRGTDEDLGRAEVGPIDLLSELNWREKAEVRVGLSRAGTDITPAN